MIIQVNLALIAIILIIILLTLKILTIPKSRELAELRFKRFWFRVSKGLI